MFNWLLEKEPAEEEIPEEEVEEEEEEEEEPQEDEQAVFYNREITECFALFDVGGNKMEEKNLRKALACLGIFLSTSELEEAVEEMELNGYIPFEKFQAFAFDKMMACDPVEALRIAFQAFDPERDGHVPSDRLRRWMTSLGDVMTEKEAKDLVKLGDPAGRGVVIYDDLVNLLVKG